MSWIYLLQNQSLVLADSSCGARGRSPPSFTDVAGTDGVDDDGRQALDEVDGQIFEMAPISALGERSILRERSSILESIFALGNGPWWQRRKTSHFARW
jgi:hypothetical protein